jgi:hypothetical protein
MSAAKRLLLMPAGSLLKNVCGDLLTFEAGLSSF